MTIAAQAGADQRLQGLNRGTYAGQQERTRSNRYAAHKMHGRGMSSAAIASHLGISERTVHRYLQVPCPEVPPAPPRPLVQLSDFYTEGACYGRLDIEWATTEAPAQVADAKQVCLHCPVLSKCRAYGLTTGLKDWGIWGALTRPERMALVKRRSGRSGGAAESVA